MTTRKFEFETEAEANAFIHAVEWVNDSTIFMKSLKAVDGKWVATFVDEDGEDNDDE